MKPSTRKIINLYIALYGELMDLYWPTNGEDKYDEARIVAARIIRREYRANGLRWANITQQAIIDGDLTLPIKPTVS